MIPSSIRYRLAVVVIGVMTAMSVVGTASAQPGGGPAHVRHVKHRHHPANRLPSMHGWHRDVARALAPVPAYLESRAQSGGRLAIVLGIDNVALATHYDWPRAVPATLRLVRRARAMGYAVFFVTGRTARNARRLAGPLRRAGFAFEGICGKAPGLKIAAGKTRCRRALTARGYTITANISTHRQAYAGGYYERRVMLPSYGGRLS